MRLCGGRIRGATMRDRSAHCRAGGDHPGVAAVRPGAHGDYDRQGDHDHRTCRTVRHQSDHAAVPGGTRRHANRERWLTRTSQPPLPKDRRPRPPRAANRPRRGRRGLRSAVRNLLLVLAGVVRLDELLACDLNRAPGCSHVAASSLCSCQPCNASVPRRRTTRQLRHDGSLDSMEHSGSRKSIAPLPRLLPWGCLPPGIRKDQWCPGSSDPASRSIRRPR